MKVILIGTQVMPLPPRSYAGVEKLVYQLAIGLGFAGANVLLVAPSGTKVPVGSRVRVLETGPPSWSNPEGEALQSVREMLIREVDSDTVVSAHTWSGVENEIFRGTGVPILHTLHGMDTNRQVWAAHPDCSLIGVSRAHAARMSELLNGREVGFIYNGVDPEEFPLVEEKSDYTLFLGLMAPTKGPDTFLDIIGGRRAVVAGEDFRIADRGFVGDLVDRINRHYPNVTYWGSIPHELKRKFQGEAMLQVYPFHPLWSEPFNLAWVEAAMSGTPLAVSDSGSMEELTADLPELYRAAPNLKLLRRRMPEIYADLEQNARARHQQFHTVGMRYTIDQMVENYTMRLQEMLRA